MSTLIKDEAVVPDDATWDDVAYAIHVRQAIEEGLAEADAGLGVSNEEVRRRFGLEKSPV